MTDCDKLHETNISRNLILDECIIKRLSNIIPGKTKLEITPIGVCPYISIPYTIVTIVPHRVRLNCPPVPLYVDCMCLTP